MKLSVFVFLLTVALACESRGQVRDDLASPDLSSIKSELKAQQAKVPELRSAVPLDAPVNPAEYVVGPGDVLAVSIWSTAPLELQLAVTPEGSLLIPGVGVMDVRGMTLDRMKSRVAEFVAKRYARAEISVTLLSPRKVAVNIEGMVLNEGKQEVYAVERVDNLIEKSSAFPTGNTTIEEYSAQLSRLRKEASERRIVVRSRKGVVHFVDLVKYRTTGLGKYNPYLCEGDNVYVPRRQEKDNAIAVFGGVKQKADFEFVPGDSLRGLIAMAMGFVENSDPEHALLTRLSIDGQRMDSVEVDARAIFEGREPDISLRPGDRLLIPQREELRQNYRVTIDGAVVNPGSYPITIGGTHLTEAIKAAGGLLPGANLKAATLVRYRLGEGLDPDAIRQEELLSRRTSVTPEDSAYYLAETQLRIKGEMVAVDFYKLFVEGDSSQNAFVRSGDKISIPLHEGTVYVFGQVIQPGHVTFAKGKDYQYYIREAGGFTNDARNSDTKVIKAKTRAWLDPDETVIEDGDFIWIPKDVHYTFTHDVAVWAQIFGIIGVVATVALLVKSF